MICVIPSCHSGDDVEPGAYACRSCHRRLVRQLGEVEEYLAIVSAVPGRSGDLGPIGRQFSSRPPARLTVIAMLDPRTEINGDGPDDVVDEVPNVAADLGGWVRIVAEERFGRQSDPFYAQDLAGQARLLGNEANFLRASIGWICEQPWVDEFARDITRVHGALRQACGDAPDRPFADCPEVVDGRVCGGPVSKHGDGLGAQCGTCRKSWRRDQLLDLLDRVAALKAG